MTAGLALGMPRIVLGAEGSSRSPSPNDTVRVAVIGLGSTTAVGGVGGRGHQLIPPVREGPGGRNVALCGVDQARSGERRVGEKGRSRWSPDHLKKKKEQTVMRDRP